MEHNPYQPPPIPDPYQTPSAPIASGFGRDVSPLAVQHLVRTQPWVRLISVVGIIFTMLMIVVLLFIPAALFKGTGRGESFAMLIPVLIIAALYLYPLLKLKSYAAAIRRLAQSHSTQDLESALNEQRAFWKFIGVIFLIGVIFYAFAIVMAIITPSSVQMMR